MVYLTLGLQASNTQPILPKQYQVSSNKRRRFPAPYRSKCFSSWNILCKIINIQPKHEKKLILPILKVSLLRFRKLLTFGRIFSGTCAIASRNQPKIQLYFILKRSSHWGAVWRETFTHGFERKTGGSNISRRPKQKLRSHESSIPTGHGVRFTTIPLALLLRISFLKSLHRSAVTRKSEGILLYTLRKTRITSKLGYLSYCILSK